MHIQIVNKIIWMCEWTLLYWFYFAFFSHVLLYRAYTCLNTHKSWYMVRMFCTPHQSYAFYSNRHGIVFKQTIHNWHSEQYDYMWRFFFISDDSIIFRYDSWDGKKHYFCNIFHVKMTESLHENCEAMFCVSSLTLQHTHITSNKNNNNNIFSNSLLLIWQESIFFLASHKILYTHIHKDTPIQLYSILEGEWPT